ncbi:hypothetical protein cypCar_00020706 [Cyprinus carpio]|nr:hypothetical protein cypCar_00020706 [Cyprinus carpio]
MTVVVASSVGFSIRKDKDFEDPNLIVPNDTKGEVENCSKLSTGIEVLFSLPGLSRLHLPTITMTSKYGYGSYCFGFNVAQISMCLVSSSTVDRK